MPPVKSAAARGRPSRLSRALVVEAALAWVRDHDLGSLSMRVLADLLEATPMALYRHVGTRDELVRLVADAALSSLTLPDDALAPIPWLRDAAQRVRTVGLEHPGLMDLLLVEGPSIRSALVILDRTVTKLHDAGVDWSSATDLHNTFFSWLAGAVRREESWRRAPPGAEPPLDRFLSLAASIPKSELPGLAAALPRLRVKSAELEFATSLEIVLAGVETVLARSSASRSRRTPRSGR